MRFPATLEACSVNSTAAGHGDRAIHRPLIIASNRAPISMDRSEGGVQVERATGGLVTALMGITQLIDATWIACAQSPEERRWKEGDVALTPSNSKVRVRFVCPSPEAYFGYYDVIANPLLWFLQHSMWDVSRAPIVDKSTWLAWEQGYQAVNQQFADEIAAELSRLPSPALVMLQDYHLYLAPRLLRQQLRRKPRPTLLHFIHIPWPGPEYWGILPATMRQAILDGLCAVDLLGFQTREDALNFLRTCESYLPRASVRYRRGRIWYRNHATHVRDFPISIDVEALRSFAASDQVAEHRVALEEIIGAREIILRVDRIEPSKNIVRGFRAYEELLELYPEHQHRVMFLALLVPSRLEVEEYQAYLDEVMVAAGRINARYGHHARDPVRILVGDDYARAVAGLQLYDVLLVNPIADGMNLVAKEGPILNAKDGVLILSERAGARQQLVSGATTVAPCDVYATAEALHQALVMPEAERAARARQLRWLIEREDIVGWLRAQLAAVEELKL
jgi:trehalose 6-phosphate synthase